MRAIGYHRVSTEDQTESGLGLDAQVTTVRAAVKKRGWELVAERSDEGKSGKNLNRPGLAEAMEVLDQGNAEVLMVAKLDRLSRSVLDFASVAERARSHNWSIVALDVDVDTTTPTGELVANITSSVAQWERRIIGQRTSEAMQALKARGKRLGRPIKLGPAVRERISADHERGMSLRAIADALNSEGVPTAQSGRWHASTIRRVLDSVALDAEVARAKRADEASGSSADSGHRDSK